MRPKGWWHDALLFAAAIVTMVTLMCSRSHAQEGQEKETASAEAASPLLPCTVPYECVNGLKLGNATISWKLSFHRARPGIYDIVHWRFTVPGRKPESERIAQLAWSPGGGAVYRIHEKVRVRDWRKLWLGGRTLWREHGPESPSYWRLVTELQAVFSLSMALRGGAEPSTLTFPVFRGQ